MDSVKINTSKTLTLTLPSDPASNSVLVTAIHDIGEDIIFSNQAATRTSAGVYTYQLGQGASGIYTLSSSGIYRIKYTYTMSNTEYTQSQYINVYVPYTDADSFFEEYPEYIDKFEDVFDKFELKARNIINTYCGQAFDFYQNKSINIDGNNHYNLHLPYPISYLNKVTMNYGQSGQEVLHDSSNSNLLKMEKVRQPGNFESSYYLRFKSSSTEFTSVFSESPSPVNNKFSSKNSYKVEGDFGWRYVPTNVQQAANLIIADLMNDDSEFRRHGIGSVSMDTVSFNMKTSFYESTGNIEADVLLMDYTMFVMDYIT